MDGSLIFKAESEYVQIIKILNNVTSLYQLTLIKFVNLKDTSQILFFA